MVRAGLLQTVASITDSQCSLTPISTIVAAYDHYLNDDSGKTGQVVECSAEKRIFMPDPPMVNGAVTKRSVTVWDPLFKMMHKENSGLPDAIP